MTVKILPRSAWNAAAPRWREPIKSSGVFIHYNGPEVSRGVLAGDYDSVASFLKGIQGFHMGPSRGWPDIAYSFAVDSMGRAWELRGWGIAGAHTLNWNWNSHAIFLPLGGDQEPTAAQLATCRLLVAEHNARFGVGFVRGHSQAPNQTACPGPKVLALVNSGAFNPSPPPTRPTPAPTVPAPPGVDLTVNKPTMMREPNGSVNIFYGGTPWRVHVKSVADVNVFRFMGVEFKDVDANTAAFFRRYSQEVKCK